MYGVSWKNSVDERKPKPEAHRPEPRCTRRRKWRSIPWDVVRNDGAREVEETKRKKREEDQKDGRMGTAMGGGGERRKVVERPPPLPPPPPSTVLYPRHFLHLHQRRRPLLLCHLLLFVEKKVVEGVEGAPMSSSQLGFLSPFRNGDKIETENASTTARERRRWRFSRRKSDQWWQPPPPRPRCLS